MNYAFMQPYGCNQMLPNTYLQNTNFNNFGTFTPTLTSSFSTTQSFTMNAGNTTNNPAPKVITDKDLADSKKSGEELYTILKGRTNNEDYQKVNDSIQSVTKDTVVSFINGYYEARGSSAEGLIEHLDDEYDNGAIKMETKLHLVKALLDKAKENGLNEVPEINESIVELEKIYNQYTTGDLKNAKDLHNNKEFSWNTLASYAGTATTIGTSIGAFFGGVGSVPGFVIGGAIGLISGTIATFCDQRTDDERIDDLMKEIAATLT